MTAQQLDVPDDVRRIIDALVESARTAFGPDLRSVILYGSAAEGRMRATSDVNLLYVLRRFDAAAADAFREPFRFAHAAANATAMFVLDGEVADAGEAFAQKFADIVRRHAVLFGEDVVSSLAIPRDALVRRLRQVLLNLTIRLRELYVERSLRDEQSALAVADAAGPLRTSAASILELEGRGGIAPKEALELMVRELGRPDLEALLPYFSEARERRVLPQGRAAEVLFGMLELARALHERALAIAP
jgi:predicted nucleotidyltransferase